MLFNSLNTDDDATFTDLLYQENVNEKQRNKPRTIEFQLLVNYNPSSSKKHFLNWEFTIH